MSTPTHTITPLINTYSQGNTTKHFDLALGVRMTIFDNQLSTVKE